MLVDLLLILVIVLVAGYVCRKLGFPPMLGELLAGLIFGPAILGVFESSSWLEILAELGMLFLMFYSGLETNPRMLKETGKDSLVIGVLGMAVPFGLGYAAISMFGGTFHQAIFMGLCLSVTAIAVTVRILRELKIYNSKIGHTILGAALIDDILAMILFSLVLGLVKSGAVDFSSIAIMLLKTILFFGVIIFIGLKFYPQISKFIHLRKGGRIPGASFTLFIILIFFFGFFAEKIGLHPIIGAFAAGLFVRQEIMDPEAFKRVEDRFYVLSYSFLAPLFFFSLAFHVDLSVFQTSLGVVIAVILLAMIGKIGGAGLGALLSKFKKKDALTIGLGMNGRAAVELALASIGLGIGVLTIPLFSSLIFMAFFTTLVTPFILKFYLKR